MWQARPSEALSTMFDVHLCALWTAPRRRTAALGGSLSAAVRLTCWPARRRRSLATKTASCSAAFKTVAHQGSTGNGRRRLHQPPRHRRLSNNSNNRWRCGGSVGRYRRVQRRVPTDRTPFRQPCRRRWDASTPLNSFDATRRSGRRWSAILHRSSRATAPSTSSQTARTTTNRDPRRRPDPDSCLHRVPNLPPRPSPSPATACYRRRPKVIRSPPTTATESPRCRRSVTSFPLPAYYRHSRVSAGVGWCVFSLLDALCALHAQHDIRRRDDLKPLSAATWLDINMHEAKNSYSLLYW